ncbi:conserved hypothetical protein [delta proteobacterium NaphS2]|nr:conserved hypothetical protein [delta proteobacterium NaphS2]
MKNDLRYFKIKDFHGALQAFFKDLNIPINYIAEEPVRAQDILSSTYKAAREAYQLMDDVYFLGMVDDAAFEGGISLDHRKIASDYDGILIFGVMLQPRPNGLPPTRTQLAEITRSFNREFHYTPVVVIFRYDNALAFANAERLKYKQEWREGEKAGKVSILRDVDLDNPHSGHLRILSELAISRSGRKAVNCFADLYAYWQSVFNVSLLNKKFYEELSNWYFWAVKEVTFPGEPTKHTLFEKTGSTDEKKLQELKQEHNAKNVIRLLTRFLFVWFIKEKKLIPEAFFDLDYIKDKLLKDVSPYHGEGTLFQSVNIKSHYYKAILQNLFFATLNQEMGKRAFRKDRQHMNVTNLLRYESCFNDPRKFIDLVESIVPFMNGGLFECLDQPHPTEKGPQGGDVIAYEDGFSDRKDNPLKVPDYLFFGLDEEVDLSSVIGIKNKKTKQAAVKGLINIFDSYKFTIAENTPIEEDIALDPELLGKVFENLLASYNPETKTTARKQTGSFYTPREIVNYMVDESLIAYLKNAVADWGMGDEALDGSLHELLSFDPVNPFANNQSLQKEIIKALDQCAILDPACGSGAFPIGILQKMVHVLQKLDPDNAYWHDLQLENAVKESERAFQNVADKQERQKLLDDINEAFDQQVNDPDYARKLFLIENCIYGVDIQPIAAQISKLRFFISLVVDQKVDKGKENFGIRPLPNLETKFVAANTLIGIEKPEKQGNLFANLEIKELEEKLKDVRHRIFSAKTPRTKRKLREEDQALREKMGELLIADGWANKTARQLAAWDPYDQNMSSPFFDPEWMFGMKDGFDVVIGNPPYMIIGADKPKEQEIYKKMYQMASYKINTYVLFLEKGLSLLRNINAILSYIIPKSLVFNTYLETIRSMLLSNFGITMIIEIVERVFDNVEVGNNILFFSETMPQPRENILKYYIVENISPFSPLESYSNKQEILIDEYRSYFHNKLTVSTEYKTTLNDIANISNGLNPGNVRHILLSSSMKSDKHQKMVLGKDIQRYRIGWSGTWVNYDNSLKKRLTPSDVKSKKGMTAQKKVDFALRKKEIFKPNKILVRKTSDHIVACYDAEGFYFDSLSYGIRLKEGVDLSIFYLLGFLNSKYTDYFHESISLNKGKVFAKVLLKNLAKLPVYEIDFKNNAERAIHDIISQIVCMLNWLSQNIASPFELVIDGLIFQLYFAEHMKEKQIDILQFVERDLAEILRDHNFEQLPDSEKKAVINKLHTRWTHPDSEVRNRIKLFAVRSPDILKPILESR